MAAWRQHIWRRRGASTGRLRAEVSFWQEAEGKQGLFVSNEQEEEEERKKKSQH